MKPYDVVGACPLDCPDTCSWLVTIEDGKAVRLRGNPDHPYTRGKLCAKVYPYPSHTNHPDRLMTPMRRVGPKGSGQFAPISWDEALEEIAERLQDDIQKYGGEAIWPYVGTGNMGYVQGLSGSIQRLFYALGASQHDATICSIAGHHGIGYTAGIAVGMDPEDLSHSSVILLWGANTLVSNQHLWPFIKEAQKKGAKLVVIDPIRTQTAKRADMHIAVHPGTDGALALGIMHHLCQIDAIDKDYLEPHTLGWEQFRQEVVASFTPSKAAELCHIEKREVIALAELIAERKPLGLRLAMGMQRHFGGGQASRVISCLPALTGDYGKLGGGLCYSTGPAYGLNKEKGRGVGLAPRPTRTLAMTELAHNLLHETEPPVKSLIMWGANPVASNPQQELVRQALSREDLFFVVIDHFQTDTADYADILLPSTMQFEHMDILGSYGHLYLQWNEPALSPPGQCLPHTEIFRRLAQKLGLTEPALFISDEEIAKDVLDSAHPSVADISLETLREQGWARLGEPLPYQLFADRYPTPSGKFEFRSEKAEADGFGLFPSYTPPREATETNKEGALALLSPASMMLMNSIFHNSPKHRKADSPTIAIHPDDAKARNIEEGIKVRVWNERGEFEAQLILSDEVQPGIALSHKGHWPRLCGGTNVNATTAEKLADMGKGAVFHDNKIWVEKTSKT